MKKTKTLRRRCENEACRKLYRHADPRAAFCSQACKQRVYRARKKAAAQVAQEQVGAELHGKYARMYARMVEQTAERERQVESNRQSAPAPRPTTATPPPAPPASRYDYPIERDPGTRVILIPNGRKMGRNMTPL